VNGQSQVQYLFLRETPGKAATKKQLNPADPNSTQAFREATWGVHHMSLLNGRTGKKELNGSGTERRRRDKKVSGKNGHSVP